MKQRIGAVICVVLLVNVAIFYKMYSIISNEQIASNQEFSSFSVKIANARGDILYRNGEKITNNDFTSYAVFTPEALNDNRLPMYLNSSQIKTLKSGCPVCEKVPDDFTMQGAVTTICSTTQNCNIPHIVGYANFDGMGVCGIEKSYDDVLNLGEIKAYVRRDAYGESLSQGVKIENKTGASSVTLTIDKDWQDVVYTALKKYVKSGAAAVLDFKTGEILASVSLPDFDINNVDAYLKNDGAPLINRTFTPFPVGSIFKICTSAVALEKNISIPHNCTGLYTLKDAQFSCMNDRAHGQVDLETALALSCNTYFVALSEHLQSADLLEKAKLLGFGTDTRLCSDLVSSAGSLPSVQTLKIAGEKANFAFGQGQLTATPLQIASLIATVANSGKRCIPTLIKSTTDKNGETENYTSCAPVYAMDDDVARSLYIYLMKAAQSGTAQSGAVAGLTIGAKTATAETGNALDAWYAGFVEELGVSIAILCENGTSGSESCAPVFKMMVNLMKNHSVVD